MNRDRFFAIFITIMILFFMSLGTIFSKLALRSIQPITLTWTTIAVGLFSMVVYTFVIKRERIPNLNKQVWIYIILIGFFNFVVSRYTQTFALNMLPAITSTYISNFIGFITMAMSIFILKEKPTIFQFLGAVIAIIGLKIFYIKIPATKEIFAIILILIGITGVAFTNNIARKLSIITNNELSNNIISTLAIVIGGGLSVIIGIALDWPPHIQGIISWGTILYVGIFSTAIGLTLWNKILRVLRSYEASILGSSNIIWTAILAVPILGETLSINQVEGIALMILGLILVQVRSRKLNIVFNRGKNN